MSSSDAASAPQPHSLEFGPLLRKVVRLGTPAVFENLLWSTMMLADAIMLARLPDNELYLAATGLTTVVLWRSETLAGASQIGTGAFVARRWGEENFAEAGRALAHAAMVAACIGVVVAIVLFFFRETIFVALGGEGRVVPAAASYFGIVLVALPARLVQLHLLAGMRAAGDTRTPLLLMATMVGLNVILNWLLIFGNFGLPRLEMNGAAVATGASYIVTAAFAFHLLRRGLKPRRLVAQNVDAPVSLEADASPEDYETHFIPGGKHDGVLRFQPGGFRLWLGSATKRIFKVTGPSYLEELAYTIGILVYIKLIAMFGTTVLAAHNVVLRIESLSFTLGLGVMIATSTLVGQALGAKDVALAKRVFGLNATIASILMGITGFLLVSFPDLFLDMFQATGGVRDVGRAIMYIIGAEQVLMAVTMAFAGGLKGAGYTLAPLVTQFSGVFIIRICLGVVLAWPCGLGVYGIYIATGVDWLARSAILYLFFRSGRWITTDV